MYPGDPSPLYTPGLKGQRCYRKEFFKPNLLCPVYNNKYQVEVEYLQMWLEKNIPEEKF